MSRSCKVPALGLRLSIDARRWLPRSSTRLSLRQPDRASTSARSRKEASNSSSWGASRPFRLASVARSSPNITSPLEKVKEFSLGSGPSPVRSVPLKVPLKVIFRVLSPAKVDRSGTTGTLHSSVVIALRTLASGLPLAAKPSCCSSSASRMACVLSLAVKRLPRTSLPSSSTDTSASTPSSGSPRAAASSRPCKAVWRSFSRHNLKMREASPFRGFRRAGASVMGGPVRRSMQEEVSHPEVR